MSLADSFKGKKVLVTGAGRGIGRELVKKLSEYGAVVYALSKTPEKLNDLQKECPSIKPILCDLSNFEQTRSVISQIETVNILINNAGVGMVNSIMDATPEEYEQIFQVNVKGTWNVTQIVAKKMVEAGNGGSITFISSICGPKAFPLFGFYCMSKASLEMMANLLAVELGPKKIRVNIVRPACVETDLLNTAETGVEKAMNIPQAFQGFIMSRTPYPGYHMEIDGLMNVILFSVSDLAPQVTGSVMTMDGGFHLT